MFILQTFYKKDLIKIMDFEYIIQDYIHIVFSANDCARYVVNYIIDKLKQLN